MGMMDITAFRSIFGQSDYKDRDYKEACDGLRLMPRCDFEVVAILSAFFQPRSFVEIGVFDGQTSKAILCESPWIEEYIGVDIIPENNPNYDELGALRDPISGKIVGPCPNPGFKAKDDSRFRITLLDQPNGLKPEMISPADIIFIDGAHSYKAVQRDTRVALEALRDKTGVLIWHDYPNEPEVKKFIYKYNIFNNNRVTHIRDTSICFQHVKSQVGQTMP